MSDFDALHGLVDGLQQRLVLRALEALLVGVHVGQGADVAVEVLLRDGLHVWQADVGQAADQGTAQTRQLHEQSLVLLLDEFVFMLNVLQVLLHRCDLCLQVDHVVLHLVVGLVQVVDFFVELLDVLIVVQNISGSELGAEVFLCRILGFLLGEQGSGTS